MNGDQLDKIHARIGKIGFALAATSLLCAAMHFVLVLIFISAGGQLFGTFAPQCHPGEWTPFFKFFTVALMAYLIYSDLAVASQGPVLLRAPDRAARPDAQRTSGVQFSRRGRQQLRRAADPDAEVLSWELY